MTPHGERTELNIHYTPWIIMLCKLEQYINGLTRLCPIFLLLFQELLEFCHRGDDWAVQVSVNDWPAVISILKGRVCRGVFWWAVVVTQHEFVCHPQESSSRHHHLPAHSDSSVRPDQPGIFHHTQPRTNAHLRGCGCGECFQLVSFYKCAVWWPSLLCQVT